LAAPTRLRHIFYPIFYSPTSSPTLSYYNIAGCRLHFDPLLLQAGTHFFPCAWPLANLEFQFLRSERPVVRPWHCPMSNSTFPLSTARCTPKSILFPTSPGRAVQFLIFYSSHAADQALQSLRRRNRSAHLI
jgi:hypothetical protein